jgi:dolichyl-phosphate-mannose-protein mannosyltransferase
MRGGRQSIVRRMLGHPVGFHPMVPNGAIAAGRPGRFRPGNRLDLAAAPCSLAIMTGDAPRYPLALAWGLAALAVRVALAARAPIIEVDGAYWAGLAQALERGDLRHGLSTAWPPLYPAFVAAILRAARLVGRAIEPATIEACARTASVIAGTLLLVPLHSLARRLLAPRAAVMATLLAAFHPRMLQYSAAALSEATFTLLLLSALALLVAREQEARLALVREAGSGALFGLAYLARPEALPLAAVLWLIGLFRPAQNRASLARLRPAFALATLIVALPWLLFIHATLGRWSLGEKGEYNFWRAFATEYAVDFPPPAGLAERVNQSPEIAPAPSSAGVHALDFTLRHPDIVVMRCALNLGNILVSTLPATLYWPLVPLALLALFRPPGRGAWPVIATLAAMPVLYAPFSVDRRFFVPAVPLLLLACAAGIDRIEHRLARAPGGGIRTHRAIQAALAVLLVLSVAYTFGKGAGFDSAPEHRRAGEWLRREAGALALGAQHPSGAGGRPVVMSRKPWVAFYSGGLIAALPNSPADSLNLLAQVSGSDVLVADERSARKDRPRLEPFLNARGVPQGFARIYGDPGPPALVLYRTSR